MADQKAGLGKGPVFIPPPTAEQIAAAKRGPAKTLAMHMGPPKHSTAAQAPAEPTRSLKKTLIGMVAAAPPAHRQERIDLTEVWAELGLSVKKKEPKKEEPPQMEEVFDRLMEFRRNINLEEVKMANFIMLQMESEFRSLLASERIQPISSGGRAFLDAEKPVAESIGKIRDEVYRRFGEDARLAKFLKDFVDAVLSSAPVTEREGKTETEMRNGFYRAVAWCLCAHNSQEQFVSYMAKNHIALIDGVGIAAGLSTADSFEQPFAMEMISTLLERKWVSLAFYHLQDMIMADIVKLDELERNGGNGHNGKKQERKEDVLDRLYANMDIYFMILFREVDSYQTLGQKYTHLAMLISNLSNDRKKEIPVMYIAPSEFYSLIVSRRMPVSKVWENLGHTHKFIAERMADREGGASHYVVGLRPKDIAQRFFTILEAVDFLTGNPGVRGIALKLISELYAPFSGDGQRNEAFKKIVALTLFTDKEDMARYPSLFSHLGDPNDPIISVRASDHKELLLNEKKNPADGEPATEEDPFANITDDDKF